MNSTKKKWDTGELLAINYLQKHGFEIRDTNFKFGRFWEIDIIAKKGKKTHFFEVKYRESEKYGSPEEAITKNKLRKFGKTIEFYVVKNGLDFENIQFDAITITKGETSYKLKHYKNLEI